MRGQKIHSLYAWICTELDGTEGIPAFSHGNVMLPLVGADRDHIEQFRDYVEFIRREKGFPVKLVKFTKMEILEMDITQTRGTEKHGH